jgi:hypothetical protein
MRDPVARHPERPERKRAVQRFCSTAAACPVEPGGAPGFVEGER